MAMVNVDVECRMCKVVKALRVDYGMYLAWKNGLLIQKAFPEMSAADRELLISKTCDACWTKIFGSKE